MHLRNSFVETARNLYAHFQTDIAGLPAIFGVGITPITPKPQICETNLVKVRSDDETKKCPKYGALECARGAFSCSL